MATKLDVKAMAALVSGLQWIYERAIDGVPGLEGAPDLAASYQRQCATDAARAPDDHRHAAAEIEQGRRRSRQCHQRALARRARAGRSVAFSRSSAWCALARTRCSFIRRRAASASCARIAW